MNLVQIGLALTWVVVTLGYWLGYQVVRQNGRLLLRLERLEDQLSRLPPASSTSTPGDHSGLPIGTAGLRRRRARPGDKWYLDEVLLKIRGKRHWLWRAVD